MSPLLWRLLYIRVSSTSAQVAETNARLDRLAAVVEKIVGRDGSA